MIDRDPDREPEPEPPALPAEALALLSAYRDDEAMPRDARRRVWNAVAAAPATRRSAAVAGRWGLWVGGGLAAAAVLLLVAHLLGAAGTAERTDDPALQAAPDRAVTPDTTGEVSSRRGGASDRPRPDEATERERDAEPTIPGAAQPPTSTPSGSAPDGSERARGAVAPHVGPRASIDPHRPPPARDATRKANASAEPADAPRSDTAGDLAAERELIAEAWRALAKGSAAQARAHAETHARTFPHGMLAPEREAVHAIAVCREASSPRPDLADAFERAHPRSPLRARVREACEPSSP